MHNTQLVVTCFIYLFVIFRSVFFLSCIYFQTIFALAAPPLSPPPPPPTRDSSKSSNSSIRSHLIFSGFFRLSLLHIYTPAFIDSLALSLCLFVPRPLLNLPNRLSSISVRCCDLAFYTHKFRCVYVCCFFIFLCFSVPWVFHICLAYASIRISAICARNK